MSALSALAELGVHADRDGLHVMPPDQLQGAMSVADGGLDYVAAAIDASTSYFSHTGTQNVARAVVRHALDERREQVWKGYLDTLR